MIDKIQELIEDNTTMDITRKQVILGLTVLAMLILLIIMVMAGLAGGPKEDAAGTSRNPIGESY